MEQAARDQVVAARARWTNAGVRASLEVLRQIAGGKVDPADRRVQLQCAEAELYLRQILLLNPEIVYMSPWIGRAIAEARSKSVALIVRVCAEDAPNEELAESLGEVILAGVAALPAGAELDVGLFASERGCLIARGRTKRFARRDCSTRQPASHVEVHLSTARSPGPCRARPGRARWRVVCER